MVSYGVLRDPKCISALHTVDRGSFVCSSMKEHAYKDEPVRGQISLGTAASQSPPTGVIHLSAPHMYASCLDALRLNEGDAMTFLNVGSGSGYLSCVVALVLGKRSVIHSVEIDPDVLDFAEGCVQEFKISHASSPKSASLPFPNAFHMEHGNGLCISPSSTLYDRIYIGAAISEEALPKITDLLAVGGVAVGPVGDSLVRITRSAGDGLRTERLSSVLFAPLREAPAVRPALPALTWSRSSHASHPDSFRESVKACLLCSAKPGVIINAAAFLPPEVWTHVFSFCGRQWFAEPSPPSPPIPTPPLALPASEPTAEELAEKLGRVELAARRLKEHFFSVLNGVPLERGDVHEILALGNFIDTLQVDGGGRGGGVADWNDDDDDDDDDDDIDVGSDEEYEDGEEDDDDEEEIFYEAFDDSGMIVLPHICDDDESTEGKPERKKARRVTLEGSEITGV